METLRSIFGINHFKEDKKAEKKSSSSLDSAIARSVTVEKKNTNNLIFESFSTEIESPISLTNTPLKIFDDQEELERFETIRKRLSYTTELSSLFDSKDDSSEKENIQPTSEKKILV